MIDQKHLNKRSKFLSLVLRHKPEEIGLQLDKQGWADVDELITKMNAIGQSLNRETLEEIVATNAKKRFAFNADKTRIRANQGHSINIDLGYTPQTPPAILYHGTGNKYVDSIYQTGLQKKNRHHVHLSSDIETAKAVGQRHGKPVVFKLDVAAMLKDGIVFYVANNGVWLTDEVLPNYLIRIEG